MINWVEFDPRIRTDRRYESLSPAEHRAWYNLLMFAAEQEEQGVLEWERNILMAEAGLRDCGDLEKVKDRLSDLKIIQEGDNCIIFLDYLTRFGREE